MTQKKLQKNITNLRNRFNKIFTTFTPEDFDNPATSNSIFVALENIRTELSTLLNRKPLKCEECGEEKNSVRLRSCAYYREVYKDLTRTEVVCDECEDEHLINV